MVAPGQGLDGRPFKMSCLKQGCLAVVQSEFFEDVHGMVVVGSESHFVVGLP